MFGGRSNRWVFSTRVYISFCFSSLKNYCPVAAAISEPFEFMFTLIFVFLLVKIITWGQDYRQAFFNRCFLWKLSSRYRCWVVNDWEREKAKGKGFLFLKKIFIFLHKSLFESRVVDVSIYISFRFSPSKNRCTAAAATGMTFKLIYTSIFAFPLLKIVAQGQDCR